MDVLPWMIMALAVVGIVWLMIPRNNVATDGEAGQKAQVSGVVLPSRPDEGAESKRKQRAFELRERLIHAGFYNDTLLPLLKVLRVAMLGLLILGGYLLYVLDVVSLKNGMTLGLLAAGFAALMPGFYLDYLKTKRQSEIRRALPDALDVIVVSLEGGLPVAASMQRVSSELSEAHPLLASELVIVQREVQMGRSLGEAMKNFAERFDLDDLRNMGSVIQQSELYGSSVTRAFRIFADGLRSTRLQKAEEAARKASVKLIFPTVLFIFPVMFVVILAPAIIQVGAALKDYSTP